MVFSQNKWLIRPYRTEEKSDHHTGLAVDFGSIGPKHPAHPRLLEHAHEYGFVQRYTKALSKDTGVGEEVWHWRYAGKEHAKKIHDYGVTLDNYIKKELYKEK